ncbi:hypothetical protein [Streptomyces sp. NPDC058989]|uniref:hypothetical protein n=1 Tax=Streptomyces sp. NPDC058989 TaxID=3346686 RepID=UPI0036C89FC9
MTDQFTCEYDGGAQAIVRADLDGFVELEVQRLDDGQEATTYVYLAPETARQFARTTTLASIAAEGERAPTAPEPTSEAPAVPCPNDNASCVAECKARSDCHREALVDLSRPVEPGTERGEITREELFLAARELAGPAAGLDDVLKVAAYLST